MLQQFWEDKPAYEMFITGRAGTGKTTGLCAVVEWLQSEGISYIVCAFTHKACGVLASKLPPDAHISTLDAFLKKRPGINQHAVKTDHVDVRVKAGGSEFYQVIIIDEYSMVGEKDYLDIIEIQNSDSEEGWPDSKLIYVGDPYQLPPVKDLQVIDPSGPYWCQLLKVHRTERQDLLDVATTLVNYIDGAPPSKIPSSEHFVRGQNLVAAYRASTADRVLLAWTNRRVQELNFQIAGKGAPNINDKLWNGTKRQNLTLLCKVPPQEVTEVTTHTDVLRLGSKWRTLEFLMQQDYVEFYAVYNHTLGCKETIAVHFGTHNYIQVKNSLTLAAVEVNHEITQQYDTPSAAAWSRANPHKPLAKRRAQAWRQLLTFKEAVMSVDFPYAMTIHKSQGSTYDEVFLDSQDLAKCADKNFVMYARLFYVAVTRAVSKVTTN